MSDKEDRKGYLDIFDDDEEIQNDIQQEARRRQIQKAIDMNKGLGRKDVGATTTNTDKDTQTNQEQGSLPAEAPVFLKNVKWFLTHGSTHWWTVLVACIVLLTIWFFGVSGIFGDK